MPSKVAGAASAAASPTRSPATIFRTEPLRELVIREDLPEEFEILDPVWIPMPDGARLAARILLPRASAELPVPAVLEYIPYRRRDGTILGDTPRHAYFAGHGYAAVRVDLRGSGDSDGLLLDEYLAQEQEDALAAIDWLAAQPWCNGKVGMMGYSWGGFNALQVAARRPPALAAIIAVPLRRRLPLHGRRVAAGQPLLGLDHAGLQRAPAGSPGGG
jgi:predicted acyl esterase